MSQRPTPPHVLVIGGGFAGTATVLRLLKDATHPLHVTVAEPRTELGLGIAYGTSDPDHLLNGQAQMFSVYGDDPQHFVRWLRAQAWLGGWQPAPGTSFETSLAPRVVYGSYVRDTLAEAIARAAGIVTLTHRRSRVVACTERRGGSGYRARFADGATVDADHVVLATGLATKQVQHLPFSVDPSLPGQPNYVDDIWADVDWTSTREDQRVVLLGAGLTALDALISAEKSGFQGRYLALSRSGLALSERQDVVPWPEFLRYDSDDVDLPDVLRQIRAQRRAVARAGENWQRLVPAIRPHVPALWRGASPRTRERFLRRLRPFWEAALHRAAGPALAWRRRVEQHGRYEHLAASVRSVTRQADGRLAVRFRDRRTGDEKLVVADKVVNCLGFEFDWRKVRDPLMTHLHASGLIALDPLCFGIRADPARCAVIDGEGTVRHDLHAVGHPLRGVLWESNAISEQVPQAGIVGRAILDALSPPGRARRLAAVFSGRAAEADHAGEPGRQNLAAVHAAGLTALVVPERSIAEREGAVVTSNDTDVLARQVSAISL